MSGVISGVVSVKSLQQGTIAMAGAGSATATITSVDTANAVLHHAGLINDTAGPNTSASGARQSLTNATTVTVTGAAGAFNVTVAYVVLERPAGFYKSINRGTITIAGGGGTTGTATIAAVDTTKAFARWLYQGTNVADDRTYGYVQITATVTVTVTRGGTNGNMTLSYETEEYAA